MSTMLLEARRVIFLSACGHLLGGTILMIIENIELMNVVHMGHHIHLTPLCLTCLLSMHNISSILTTPHRKILEGLPQRLQLSSSKKEVSPKPSMKPRLPGILPEGCVAFLAV